MSLDPADRIEIHELAANYGNSIDDRDWDALGRVFSDDAVFVLTDGDDVYRYEGFASIRDMMEHSATHPVTHHVTNVAVTPDADAVRLMFKVAGVGFRGRVGSADYHDVVRRGPDGWRIVEHLATIRRPEPRPESD